MKHYRLFSILLACILLSGCMVPRGNGETWENPTLSESPTETPEVTEVTEVTAPTDTPVTLPSESSTEESSGESNPIAPPETTEEPSATPPETPPEELPPLEVTKTEVYLNEDWEFADFSAIHTGAAILYQSNRSNGIIVGVNAGHGTSGGMKQKTYCHPDKTPKVTGGTTSAGAIQSYAVSSGMSFRDGTAERAVTLATARLLRDKLLEAGFDVLMLRDDTDVQLDNVARAVICNNVADCHISLHWDSDSKDFDKGAYYMSVPDGIKYLPNVAHHWEVSEDLGDRLITGLRTRGVQIFKSGSVDQDLTQTSFSWVPTIDIELGNQCSDHSDEWLDNLAEGLLLGIKEFFEQ